MRPVAHCEPQRRLGEGPQRAELLQKELRIFTFGDLLGHYPFRYEDRTRFYSVAETNETMPYVQLKGKIESIGIEGSARKKRLVANFTDGTNLNGKHVEKLEGSQRLVRRGRGQLCVRPARQLAAVDGGRVSERRR